MAAKIVDHFLGAQRSPHTRRAYQHDLATFAKFFGLSEIDAVRTLLRSSNEGGAMVVRWLDDLEARGLASSTRARFLSTIRNLVNTAYAWGLVSWQLKVPLPKELGARGERVAFPLEKIAQMLTSCGDDRVGRRDRVALLLLVGVGLRRVQLNEVRVRDYCDGCFRVVEKGREHQVALPPRVRSVLDEWLLVAPIVEPDDYLVCSLGSRPGRHLSLSSINRLVEVAGARVGVKVSPNELRRSIPHPYDTAGIRAFSRLVARGGVEIYDDLREARAAIHIRGRLAVLEMLLGGEAVDAGDGDG